MSLTGVVVGLGNIGQGYDYDCRDDSRVLSHAQAFHTHPLFSLAGGVDPDALARSRFEKKFGVPAWESLDQAKNVVRPDIWALAVPTSLHVSTIKSVLSCSPRAILCEKPLAETLQEAQAAFTLAQEAGVPLMVNYIRRCEPATRQLKELIQQGEIGDVYKGVVWYAKGLRHNGSHFLDLMDFLLGPVQGMTLLDRGRTWAKNDFEPDVKLRFGATDVFFLSGREEWFSLKDFELIGTAGRIQYRRGGESILVQKTVEQKLFPGYKILEDPGTEIPNQLARYQWHVLDVLQKHLLAGCPLPADGLSGIRLLETLDRIEQTCRRMES
jgi:predicted dehydrogenase